MHLQTSRATNGFKSRSVLSRRERELDRSGLVQKANYVLSRSWSVRGYFPSHQRLA